MLGHKIIDAQTSNGQVQLGIQSADGGTVNVKTDHVIAATGYSADVDRLGFIDKDLRWRVRRIGRMPALSPYFESSVPGLYFVGNAAAGSFGPLMRFVYGCTFAAHRITKHLVR